MSVKLRVGALQRRLVRKFTNVEVITLTVWLYLALAGLGLFVLGVADFHAGDNANGYFFVILGILLTILSVLILDAGLSREHTIATETGNAGPDAIIAENEA